MALKPFPPSTTFIRFQPRLSRVCQQIAIALFVRLLQGKEQHPLAKSLDQVTKSSQQVLQNTEKR